jgi:hypothetical protein
MLTPLNYCTQVALASKPRNSLFRYVSKQIFGTTVWGSVVYSWRISEHKRHFRNVLLRTIESITCRNDTAILGSSV